MSAELGLALAGVAATGAAISKALFDIYHTVRHSPRDIKGTATYLELLRSFLKELQHMLRKSEDVCWLDVGRTIRDLLAQGSQIFDAIESLIAPLQPADGGTVASNSLREKIKRQYKRDDLNLLKCRLEALKSTIHLIVSIIHLRRQLSSSTSRECSRERTSGRLKSALRIASELVEGERNCLADLLLIEEQFHV
jgi:hypothetical protein